MRSPLLALSLVSASVAIFAACGGGTPAANSPNGASSASASASSTEVAAPAGPWSDKWSVPEQVAFMKAHVMPAMGPVFQAADAKRYADFGCQTCHGDKLPPKQALPHLTMKDGKITSFAEKPEVSKFMAEKVVPAMATAMGLPPYDPATHQGFGCGGCHAIDMK